MCSHYLLDAYPIFLQSLNIPALPLVACKHYVLWDVSTLGLLSVIFRQWGLNNFWRMVSFKVSGTDHEILLQNLKHCHLESSRLLLSLLTAESNHLPLHNTTNKWKKQKPKISPTEHKNHSMSPVQYLACNEGGNYMKDKMLNAPQLRTPSQPILQNPKTLLWMLGF